MTHMQQKQLPALMIGSAERTPMKSPPSRAGWSLEAGMGAESSTDKGRGTKEEAATPNFQLPTSNSQRPNSQRPNSQRAFEKLGSWKFGNWELEVGSWEVGSWELSVVVLPTQV